MEQILYLFVLSAKMEMISVPLRVVKGCGTFHVRLLPLAWSVACSPVLVFSPAVFFTLNSKLRARLLSPVGTGTVLYSVNES